MLLLRALCFLTCSSVVLSQLGSITKALLGQYPSVVSLQSSPSKSHICVGSIISPSLILTPANCVYGRTANSLNIVAGTTVLNGSGTTYAIKKISVHENYDPNTHDYDIALLHTKKTIAFPPLRLLGINIGHTVSSIALGTTNFVDNFTVNDAPAVVSGFGTTDLPLNTSPVLLYVHVPIQSKATCSKYFLMTDRMICAGSENGQESSCPGDSGGPLTVNGKLVGIVSYGPGCGLAAPAVYVNVSNLRSWIKQKTGI